MRDSVVHFEYYKAPNSDNWKGRYSNPDLSPQYWYEQVELLDFSSLTEDIPYGLSSGIAICGYACDEGVIRNQGRAGAVEGPGAIRRQLAKLAYHHDMKRVVDVGDIVYKNQYFEKTHFELAKSVHHLLNCNYTPILLGGGHDMAYGHFTGIKEFAFQKGKPKIGIINFDAHFDLRSSGEIPHSGSPFYQIMSENPEDVSYFVLGLQKPSNTKELFLVANDFNVRHILSDDCTISNLSSVIDELSSFAEDVDLLYVTIDMDGIASAHAPGVSAPSPTGMEPVFVLKILSYLISTGKVISYDIAEVNPPYDRDYMTANLAARIVDTIVSFL